MKLITLVVLIGMACASAPLEADRFGCLLHENKYVFDYNPLNKGKLVSL